VLGVRENLDSYQLNRIKIETYSNLKTSSEQVFYLLQPTLAPGVLGVLLRFWAYPLGPAHDVDIDKYPHNSATDVFLAPSGGRLGPVRAPHCLTARSSIVGLKNARMSRIFSRILAWASCKPTFTLCVTCDTHANNDFNGCCNRSSSSIANIPRSSTMSCDACSYNARVRDSAFNFSRALPRLPFTLCVSSFRLFHS
jgi:hypothetical protein